MQWLRIIGMAMLVSCAAWTTRAATFEFFGLDHVPIGSASVASNDYLAGVFVADLSPEGTNGIATLLGQSDSGAFFYPHTPALDTGYFMRADVFGSVSGNPNALIGSISGTRVDYATFHVVADYSAIGATSLTFQAWSGNFLRAESTVTSGVAVIYSESGYPVRVNPWWRPPGGEFGAAIDFNYTASVALPPCTDPFSCGDYSTHRLFIRPNGATGVVEYVSRANTFGGGGLPSFELWDVKLGMFGNPHTALGFTKYTATNGVLRVNEVVPATENGNGTLVRFDHAESAAIQFEPIDLARPNTNEFQERLDVSVTGTHSGYSTFISTATLANSNGVLWLSAAQSDSTETVLSVYSNSVLVATQTLALEDRVMITGAPRVSGTGARAETLAGIGGTSLEFDASAAFALPQGDVVNGNRIVLNSAAPSEVADIVGVAVTTKILSSFTITGESSVPLSLPSLSISRSNETIMLHWIDPADAYFPQVKYSFENNEPWRSVESTRSHTNGVTTVLFDLNESPAAYFRLIRYLYND
jgi:hypothetical protein